MMMRAVLLLSLLGLAAAKEAVKRDDEDHEDDGFEDKLLECQANTSAMKQQLEGTQTQLAEARKRVATKKEELKKIKKTCEKELESCKKSEEKAQKDAHVAKESTKSAIVECSKAKCPEHAPWDNDSGCCLDGNSAECLSDQELNGTNGAHNADDQPLISVDQVLSFFTGLWRLNVDLATNIYQQVIPVHARQQISDGTHDAIHAVNLHITIAGDAVARGYNVHVKPLWVQHVQPVIDTVTTVYQDQLAGRVNDAFTRSTDFLSSKFEVVKHRSNDMMVNIAMNLKNNVPESHKHYIPVTNGIDVLLFGILVILGAYLYLLAIWKSFCFGVRFAWKGIKAAFRLVFLILFFPCRLCCGRRSTSAKPKGKGFSKSVKAEKGAPAGGSKKGKKGRD